MIDAEKLLGGLLRQALTGGRRRRRRRRSGLSRLLGGGNRLTKFSGGVTGAAGLGLLGVAIAAFEHFSQKGGQPAQAPTGAVPPPPPPSTATPPPPPPGSTGVEPPQPPGAASEESQKTALLLIQGMIAAAHADGNLDQDEEREILEQLGQAGLTLEEREFILEQMESPTDIESILAQIDTPELAKHLYAVSLLAIEVDTEAESEYLAMLRSRLNIGEAEARQLHRQLGDSE